MESHDVLVFLIKLGGVLGVCGIIMASTAGILSTFFDDNSYWGKRHIMYCMTVAKCAIVMAGIGGAIFFSALIWGA